MTKVLIIVCVCAAVLALKAVYDYLRMRRFWRRPCTGRLWLERFPTASKAEIREFLTLFTAAFGFSKSRGLQFAPGDRVMQVYSALYPASKVMPDCLELENFMAGFKENYHVDLVPLWREDITLGELFSYSGGQHKRSSSDQKPGTDNDVPQS